MSDNRPIGIFDSGIGGLTVLESICGLLPNESFIYVADHLHCPYGVKSYEEIKAYSLRICKYLVAQNVKAIVIACNTASVVKAELDLDIPIINVIEPTIQEIIVETKNKKVGLLGTKFTISSNQYQNALIDNDIEVYDVICDELVKMAETSTYDYQILKNKLHIIGNDVDTIVLGCTHFGLLKQQIKNILGERNYIECGKPTAEELYKFLRKNNLLSENKVGKTSFFSTNIKKINQRILRDYQFHQLDI